jgi:putative transposase
LKYKRHRTTPKDIPYGLYLYFLGLSYRNTAKALHRIVERSLVSIWKWIQRYKPKKISSKRKKINEFIIGDILIKIGFRYIWSWFAIESKSREILQFDISFEHNMLIA